MGEAASKEHLSIKVWAEDDRPREKMLSKGRTALSDAELIAILISSGSRDESAVALAKRILSSCDNNLNSLGKRSIADLVQFRGIGEAKAVSIAAALELGRRRKLGDSIKHPKISDSSSAYEAVEPYLSDLGYEEFHVLLLNRANELIEIVRVSQGGVSGTVADARLIFKRAIETLASGVILAHNHPSGNLKPSQADLSLTKRLTEAGKLLEIHVLDHIIVGNGEYVSFADDGIL